MTPADLGTVLPRFVADALRAGLRQIGARLPAFLLPDALLIAAETRTSAPVRFLRYSSKRPSHHRLTASIPAAKGRANAGGIVSAALDGARVAERILAG